MYKATSKGVIKEGRKLPPLTEEDKETIREMFNELSELALSREANIWDGNELIIKRT